MKEKIEISLHDVLSLEKTPDQRVDGLFELMQVQGQSYYDEAVTQREQALQAARRARSRQASMEQ
ncbi:MAG: HD family phosphohydrolase, partial [Gimesia chilikensis]